MYTMCPPGCYHNGFMATPELGHRMYGYIYIYIPCDHVICTPADKVEPERWYNVGDEINRWYDLAFYY